MDKYFSTNNKEYNLAKTSGLRKYEKTSATDKTNREARQDRNKHFNEKCFSPKIPLNRYWKVRDQRANRALSPTRNNQSLIAFLVSGVASLSAPLKSNQTPVINAAQSVAYSIIYRRTESPPWGDRNLWGRQAWGTLEDWVKGREIKGRRWFIRTGGRRESRRDCS